jgi:NAD(P)-dependent dehydrogenase (short-subunit alcohol dehydrogenase family)
MTHPSGPGVRVLVVTGASSGIGRATALEAAGRGEHLVLAARGADALTEVAVLCQAAGAASALTVATDVGDDDAVAALVRRVLDEHGRLDAFVNCAGVVAYGRTEEVPAEVFDGVLRTNLVGSVNVARHVVPVLRRQGCGVLLLVGSVVGHLGVPSMSPYIISKWGVRSLARQLALENRDLSDVRVEYVAPGGVDTPIYEQGANYSGYEGRPPPPVSDPRHAARQILRRLDGGWLPLPSQLTPANDVIRFGFSFLPAVYDRIVGPLFRVAATNLTRPVPPSSGNVLESQEDGHELHGEQGSALVGIGQNLLQGLRRRD